MKTLLLNKNGDVYKITGENPNWNGITYMCEKGVWCSEKGDYLFDSGLVYSTFIHEHWVECIDTNTSVILNEKSSMIGFDLDYIDQDLYS